MSAGPFIKTFYETDDGLVGPTRLQPETELAQFGGVVNDAPSTTPTPGAPYLPVSVGKRSPQIQMRYAIVELTADGTGKTVEYQAGNRYRVVVPDPTVFASWSKNDTGTYNGIAAIIRRKVGEVS